MGALKIEDVCYTYDDYKLWGGDWELFSGVPISMAPAPMINHQMIASEFMRELGNQLEECNQCAVLGEVDYKISDETLLRPDIVLICNEENDAYLTKAPEIVVEIISKSTAKRDETYKFDIYEKEKVKYYIIVYPDDLKAKVYKLDAKEYDKQGDFTNETYKFENTRCKVSADFERIFRRFKRK